MSLQLIMFPPNFFDNLPPEGRCSEGLDRPTRIVVAYPRPAFLTTKRTNHHPDAVTENSNVHSFVCACVCVCVCFLSIHSGHQVRWTYQPGSHRRNVTQDFSSTFFLRCVPQFFSQEGFSHSFPSSTVKSSNFVY